MRSTFANAPRIWAWRGLVRDTFEKSAFMRDRINSFDVNARDMAKEIDSAKFSTAMDLMLGGRPLQGVQAIGTYLKRHLFYPMGVVTAMMDTLIWRAAYDKASAGQVDNIAADNEGDKVAYADSVVAMTSGSGLAEDLAPIQRTNELGKLITPMWSFFGTQYNQLYNEQIPGLFNRKISPFEFLTFLFMMMLGSVLADLLAGKLDGEDDERDKALVKTAATALTAPMAGVPLLRDVTRQGVETLATGKEYDLNAIPAMGAVSSASGVLSGGINDMRDGEIDRQTVKDAVYLSGYIWGIPSRQAWTTGEYAYDVATGEEDPAADPMSIYEEGLLRDQR
jgi:hypothetical protein